MHEVADGPLKSLPRMAITELYEYVHVQRFATFLSELNHNARDLEVVRSLENIKSKHEYLWHVTRELVLTCYESLFEIQRERFAAKWLRMHPTGMGGRVLS